MTEINNRLFVGISTIMIITLLLSIGNRGVFNSANGQPSLCDNGPITGSDQKIPVILVHGYHEGSWVWSQWEQRLGQDNIPFCTVTFHPNDECDSAASDAKQLAQIVQQVKSMTGQNQVNIVGHSKGGLDARVYLATSGANDVANLIMVGTPNAGTPIADNSVSLHSDTCTPALDNFTTYADDLNVKPNNNTKYYTIAGDWTPSLAFPWIPSSVTNCPTQPGWQVLEVDGYGYLISTGKGANDGLVPISSVESQLQSYFHHLLPHTSDCHTNLLGNDEYDLSSSILLGR